MTQKTVKTYRELDALLTERVLRQNVDWVGGHPVLKQDLGGSGGGTVNFPLPSYSRVPDVQLLIDQITETNFQPHPVWIKAVYFFQGKKSGVWVTVDKPGETDSRPAWKGHHPTSFPVALCIALLSMVGIEVVWRGDNSPK